jgi:DtxR family Mn-dependent transcriptional regulator
MPLRLLSRDERRLLFWAGGDEHVLAPMVAANIFVKPIEEEPEPVDGEQLKSLAIGESAQVIGLAPSLRGAERRRMMDLGLLPGTTVRAENTGAGGSPTAYRIRGALIALRDEQAAQIIIRKEGRQDHD